MPRCCAHFSSEELVRVLSHYSVGIIHKIEPLFGGNRRAPKMVVSEQGMFLLNHHPRSTYFLLMIRRKTDWLNKNRDQLTKLITV